MTITHAHKKHLHVSETFIFTKSLTLVKHCLGVYEHSLKILGSENSQVKCAYIYVIHVFIIKFH